MNGEVRVTSSEIGLLGRLNAAAAEKVRVVRRRDGGVGCVFGFAPKERRARRAAPRRVGDGGGEGGELERTVATLDAHATAVEERMRKIRGNERAGVAGAAEADDGRFETFPWDGFEKTRFRRPVSRAWKRTTL